MKNCLATELIHHIRRIALSADRAKSLDHELVEAFVAHRDEAAFEAIVRRHGAMVLGVCRRLLQNHHDAEDAFQATFLVLARRAASVQPRHLVGNWLYGVAYRTVLELRRCGASDSGRNPCPTSRKPLRRCLRSEQNYKWRLTGNWLACRNTTER